MKYIKINNLKNEITDNNLSNCFFIISHYLSNGNYTTNRFLINNFSVENIDNFFSNINISYENNKLNDLSIKIDPIFLIENNNSEILNNLSNILSTNFIDNIDPESIDLSITYFNNTINDINSNINNIELNLNESNVLYTYINDNILENSFETVSTINDFSNKEIDLYNSYLSLSSFLSTLSNDLSTKYTADLNKISEIKNINQNIESLTSNTESITLINEIKTLSSYIIDKNLKNIFSYIEYEYIDVTLFDKELTKTYTNTGFLYKILNIQLQQQKKITIDGIETTIWLENNSIENDNKNLLDFTLSCNYDVNNYILKNNIIKYKVIKNNESSDKIRIKVTYLKIKNKTS